MALAALLLTPTLAQFVVQAFRPLLRWVRPVEGTLAADSSGATSIAANTGDITLAGLSTRGPDGVNAAGVAGGNISVLNNAAAGKNIGVGLLLQRPGLVIWHETQILDTHKDQRVYGRTVRRPGMMSKCF